MASGAALRIDGLSHRYGKTVALEAISFAIPQGASAALVGPDGVGKSTLLGVIAGAKRIQAGQVEVLGGDMRDRRHRRAVGPRIAYMPQGLGRNLYPTLSVVENIDFFGHLFGLAPHALAERRAQLLAATGLAPFPDRPAGKLSGGMKQKLGLCCALVHDPDLLILDEPTTGVDPLSRRQFWELIASIRADRPAMTMLVATAYMEEAEGFDHLVAIDQGRLLAAGPTRDVIAATGAAHLDAAYVALRHRDDGVTPPPLVIPPRTQHDGAPAIIAEGLTRRFGDFVAVDHASFRIERGEIFGFLGSNGSGKTTTMKMLTGLLAASEGTAELLGRPVQAQDIATRLKIGYMSQGFSLYEELTVRANLTLHARLYRIAAAEVKPRVDAALARFDLAGVADALPGKLPLGLRQRLQLAAACLHRPEILILDEPTSGVDPEARDGFWRLILELSRQEAVTIFISTHFMNEAERCDRISLMHRGRTLAVGTPAEIVAAEGVDSLEEAFIRQIARAEPESTTAAAPAPVSARTRQIPLPGFVQRPLAFARREMIELIRDPVRLAFAFLGPVFLMITFGFGISFDVDHLTYAVLDRDQSLESRTLLENFQGSRYFLEQPPLYTEADIDLRLRSGELKMALEVPPDFGRDLLAGRKPEIGVYLDGSMPFRAETIRGYVDGISLDYVETRLSSTATGVLPVSVQPRFRYNQDFKSVVAIVPGVFMLLLMLIPAMLTAVGVVREKELGSIANLYVSPAGIGEFLIGKQLPYVLLGFIAFLLLAGLAAPIFDLLPKGSITALALGALLYVAAATSFGLLVSAFVRTQVAAIFAASILCMIPTVNFSGLFYPTSTLEGTGRIFGMLFPASWFQTISLGVFDKGLGFAHFLPQLAALAGFALVFLGIARLLVRKQER
ncbi:ribosome-associated ATPase/putative transporter RbbA [Dongia sedimenti]|uniref:Ribosome-associated ATPase/putative transporter RbbA n=1 Tax=Dongia sedimenti TaxID=3064282 RepID=A0ABU0YUD2_9PROT|nr:ribosome-associated ATPase/putative transporter RbbA [Rhodospirillaceae bacterium R-7]